MNTFSVTPIIIIIILCVTSIWGKIWFWNYGSHDALGDVTRKYNVAIESGLKPSPSYMYHSILKDISWEVKGDETQITALSGSCEVINVLPVKWREMKKRGWGGGKRERVGEGEMYDCKLKHSKKTGSTEAAWKHTRLKDLGYVRILAWMT